MRIGTMKPSVLAVEKSMKKKPKDSTEWHKVQRLSIMNA
jgi:hypothetical protein